MLKMRAHGMPAGLTDVSAVEARFRHLFKFDSFNEVQSKCFAAVYSSDDNFVLSAPTGSGKTVICELAMCRLLAKTAQKSFKVVYQAPIKSICSERQRDWSPRFASLGLRTAELTGDSETSQLKSLQHTDIIITTPEKWDSVTRKWNEHKSFLSKIKLFLVDEIHVLNDQFRGAALEAVVTRMCTIAQPPRIIALSATLPNLGDICRWLGKSASEQNVPARCEQFSADARPVPLEQHVLGFPSRNNDYSFERSLTAQIPALITHYSKQKPIMIFCSTRTSCVETAKSIRDWWLACPAYERSWRAPGDRLRFDDKALQDLSASGVAFHHGGLSGHDRVMVEASYSRTELGVLCCTSTLAVGVNLPCHMVIIKGTMSMSSTRPGHTRSYSDLELLQMLGRAGRPQFDNSAVGIIMTRLDLAQHYQMLSSGREPVESQLHRNLIGHLNAEIVLGTVRDMETAELWLKSTFMYIRMQQNPAVYNVSTAIDLHLHKICLDAIEDLQHYGLVRSTTLLNTTPTGTAMARYYVHFDTMKQFVALTNDSTTSDILKAIAMSVELSEVCIRASERQMLTTLDQSRSTRFPLCTYIDASWQKVYLIMQWSLSATEPLSGTPAQHRDMNVTTLLVNRQTQRLMKCLTECMVDSRAAMTLYKVLFLSRSIAAGAWDDSPLSMMQLEGIGIAGVRKLVGINVRNVEEIAMLEPDRIERAFSRNPPFGHQLIKKAEMFPRLILLARPQGRPERYGCEVKVKLEVEVGLLTGTEPLSFNGKAVSAQLLCSSQDGTLLHFSRISASKVSTRSKTIFLADLTSSSNTIDICAMCEDIAGTAKHVFLDIPVDSRLLQPGEDQSTGIPLESLEHGAPDNESDRFDDDQITDHDLTDTSHKLCPDPDVVVRRKSSVEHGISHKSIDKLPGGRWRCKHLCKDKSTCRHLCCRQGLNKPPRPSRAEAVQTPTTKSFRQTLLSNCEQYTATTVEEVAQDDAVTSSRPKKRNRTSPGAEDTSSSRIDTIYDETALPVIYPPAQSHDGLKKADVSFCTAAQHKPQGEYSTHDAAHYHTADLKHEQTPSSLRGQPCAPGSHSASRQAKVREDTVRSFLGDKYFVFED